MNDHFVSNLDAHAKSVRTRRDLAAFVRVLQDDLARHHDEWENNTLPSFLEALAAWTDDMEGAFQNQGRTLPEAPTWQLFAEMLLATQIYE